MPYTSIGFTQDELERRKRELLRTTEANSAYKAPISGEASSGVFGGVAGLGAASVMGGPVGVAVGLGVGLLAERFRRSELDAAANSVLEAQQLTQSVADTIDASAPFATQHGSDIDLAQLALFKKQSQQAFILANSMDPNSRERGLNQLETINASVAAWHQDIENRTREVADATLLGRSKVGEGYQRRIEMLSDRRTAADIDADTLINYANEFKNDQGNVAYQQAVRNVLSLTGRDQKTDGFSASFAPFGVGLSKDFGDKKFSYDEGIRIAEAYRQGQTARISQELDATRKLAESQGFVFGTTKEGAVSVTDLQNVDTKNFRSAKPISPAKPLAAEAPKPPADAGRDAAQAANSVIDQGVDYAGGILSQAKDDAAAHLDMASEIVGDALKGAGATAQNAFESVLQWAKKRPRYAPPGAGPKRQNLPTN